METYIENNVKKCSHCNQAIRAKDGEGTQGFDGVLVDKHFEVLRVMNSVPYNLSKQAIFDKSKNFNVSTIHTAISELLNSKHIKLIKCGKPYVYMLTSRM